MIDGYIIKVDYSEQRKLAAEVNKIGVNINQICKRINSTDRVYSEDVAELRKRMDEVWGAASQSSGNSKILKTTPPARADGAFLQNLNSIKTRL